MARPRGSPNQPKRRLLTLLQEIYPDYQPVLEMAKLAHKAMQEGDDEVAFNRHAQVARYVTPQLKAIELSGNDGEPLKVGLVQFVDTGTN